MKTRILLLMCILPAILCTAAQAKVIYVDDGANGVNDGSSWENAFTYLRDALTTAELPETEKPLEIRVAQGIYKPNQRLIYLNPPVLESFYLINNVAIKGGYAGVYEPDPNARNIEIYKSFLSGDLNGDDIEVNDPCDLWNELTRRDNSFHVLSSRNNNANAVLDGFIVTSGYYSAFGEWAYSGGAGMSIYQGNPTIVNCTFTNNVAYAYPGGLGIFGGGVFIAESSPTMINCTFTKNYGSYGGGICNGRAIVKPGREGNPIFINCVFSNNYSISKGAGMYNFWGQIAMSNCTFTGNFSEVSGGGLYTSANAELENCIFNGNWAKQDSAIAKNSSSILNISNSIIWNGQNAISDSNSSTLTVSYSDIQGGLEGTGNIDTDPLFANPGYWADVNDINIIVEPNDPNAIWIDGDYHLKSQAGRWDSNTQSWVQDDVTSPCIDAGDPMSPIGLEPFPNGGRINMGAYGGTAEASKSYFGKPVCQTIVAGDINGDCKVDILDLEIMMSHWLEEH
jgi:predicted outer membrane repeat protein